jgi:hypothetical protein
MTLLNTLLTAIDDYIAYTSLDDGFTGTALHEILRTINKSEIAI